MIITNTGKIISRVKASRDREIITRMRYNFDIKNSLFDCFPRKQIKNTRFAFILNDFHEATESHLK